MKLFGKNLDTEIAIVAEIGVNHEGDVDAAMEMLSLAAGAGADAAKLQSYIPESYASANDPERLARVAKFALDENEHRILAGEAKRLGIDIFSTPLSQDIVPLLDSLFPAFKIASGDLTFEPVIRAAAATEKPVILSTGLGNFAEIETAIGWVRDEVGEVALCDRLVIMHCVSAYPTEPEEANVLSVPWLAEKTGLRVGFSNHVIGPEACFAAIAHGASVIEVHFTDCKTGRDFHDHALSFDQSDLKQLVALAPGIRASVGEYSKDPQPGEMPNLLAARKGVIAARDLEAGAILGEADLAYARPATEFAASELPDLICKPLNCQVKKGELIPRNGVHIE